MVAGMLRRRGLNLKNALIIGDRTTATRFAADLAERGDLGYRILEVLDISTPRAASGLDTVKQRIDALCRGEGLDEVFVVLPITERETTVHDLVIANARIVDGTGAPARDGALAVRDCRISAIGAADDLGPARERVDAEGLVLAPGIVDIHTHYDAQLTWDPFATPSSALGVTTPCSGKISSGSAGTTSALGTARVRGASGVRRTDSGARGADATLINGSSSSPPGANSGRGESICFGRPTPPA